MSLAIAEPVGSIQEASGLVNGETVEVSRLPPSEKWYNPQTGRVEPLSTSPSYMEQTRLRDEMLEAQRKAARAREQFYQKEGFDRMGSDPNPEPFEPPASTPSRAGPGLGVSPTNVIAGVGAGVGLAVGGALLAAASKKEPETTKSQESYIPDSVIPPKDTPPPPVIGQPTGGWPTIDPSPTFSILQPTPLVDTMFPFPRVQLIRRRKRRFPFL